jgi:hypothetical protein
VEEWKGIRIYSEERSQIGCRGDLLISSYGPFPSQPLQPWHVVTISFPLSFFSSSSINKTMKRKRVETVDDLEHSSPAKIEKIDVEQLRKDNIGEYSLWQNCLRLMRGW